MNLGKLTDWKNVSDTLLIPLYCRAKESERKNPIIHDAKAVEIFSALLESTRDSERPIHRKIRNGSYPRKLAVTMALRARKFDTLVSDFIKDNPEGTVVNIGCGLDTRFSRVDNGKLTWYDLDFPEVLEIKKRFYPETERYRYLPVSAGDLSWVDSVKAGAPEPVLFTAEGLFMYLEETTVREILSKIASVFPGARAVFEVVNSFLVRSLKNPWIRWKFTRQLGFSEDSLYRSGVGSAREVEAWGHGFTCLEEWTYFDDDEPRLGFFRVFRGIRALRYAQWTLVFRLGGTD